jgi:transposase
MIAITPHMHIMLAACPVDFRKGIDGLAAVCRNILEADPFCGYLFVFTNKSKKSIKILVYDGQGFWLCQKRLSAGRFCFWPDSNGRSSTLQANQLSALIYNQDPRTKTFVWKKVQN